LSIVIGAPGKHCRTRFSERKEDKRKKKIEKTFEKLGESSRKVSPSRNVHHFSGQITE
jgi:hypothetical protein